jgi:hypothetical protein
MSRRCRSTAVLAALLVGMGTVPGGFAGDRPDVHWELPGLLNLRLPPQKYAPSVPEKVVADDWPSILLPRRDFSRPPPQPSATAAASCTSKPREVRRRDPAAFVGPNCGPKCASRIARDAEASDRISGPVFERRC